MGQTFIIHPHTPQLRLIRQAARVVRGGGVIVYPTDSCYALGCRIGDKAGQERVRAIRELDTAHQFTLLCRNLSELARYARVDDRVYRLLRASTPGSYTFVLRATREVPRRLLDPRRSTIGVRVPDHAVVQALLAELEEPLLSSTLLLPGDDWPLNDSDQIRSRLEHRVDLILDAGACGVDMTTVIDLTSDTPEVVRVGKGSLEPFGLPS